MALRRGDVVLVPFSASDLTSTKVRPAVIVSSKTFTTAEGRIIIAGITSNIRLHRNRTSYELPDWQAAGLKKPSTVTSWLASITPKIVQLKVGHLSEKDIREIEARLRAAMDL